MLHDIVLMMHDIVLMMQSTEQNSPQIMRCIVLCSGFTVQPHSFFVTIIHPAVRHLMLSITARYLHPPLFTPILRICGLYDVSGSRL